MEYFVQLIDDHDVVVDVTGPHPTLDDAQRSQASLTKQLQQTDWLWSVESGTIRIKELRVVTDVKFKTKWYFNPLFVFGVIGAAAGAVWLFKKRQGPWSKFENKDDVPTGGSLFPPMMLAKKLGGAKAPAVQESFEPPEWEPLAVEKVPVFEPPEWKSPEPPLAPKPSKAPRLSKPKKVEPVKAEPAVPEKLIMPEPEFDVPAGTKFTEEHTKLFKEVDKLIERYEAGKAHPREADAFCSDKQLGGVACEHWCYRIGYSTGFCVEGKCYCSGWQGEEHPQRVRASGGGRPLVSPEFQVEGTKR